MCTYFCRLKFYWCGAADVGFRVCGVTQSDGTSNSETPNPAKKTSSQQSGRARCFFAGVCLGCAGLAGRYKALSFGREPLKATAQHT